MLHITRPLFSYGSSLQSPIKRLSGSIILENVSHVDKLHPLALWNQIQMGVNCTKIAIKYSKCYLCRFPVLRYSIRNMYGMEVEDEKLRKIDELFLSQCPIEGRIYRKIFNRFQYENKGIYAALSLLVSSNSTTIVQQQKIIKFMTALELVNLGFALHHSIGKSQKLNLATRIALKLMSKNMKDSYLVLGGDYFHIRGSVLAAETGDVRLSELLSEVEIDMCKYVHLVQQMKNKIREQGYDSVQIEQIYDISVLKVSPLVKGLMAMDIIKNQNKNESKNESKDQSKDESKNSNLKQAYECLALNILYRRDLQNFMFNFKKNIEKYLEYSPHKIKANIDCEQSLPYYILSKGAHENKRMDISYLNTVTMMSQEIEYLQNRLVTLLGEEKAREVEQKIKYYLMIYS